MNNQYTPHAQISAFDPHYVGAAVKICQQTSTIPRESIVWPSDFSCALAQEIGTNAVNILLKKGLNLRYSSKYNGGIFIIVRGGLKSITTTYTGNEYISDYFTLGDTFAIDQQSSANECIRLVTLADSDFLFLSYNLMKKLSEIYPEFYDFSLNLFNERLLLTQRRTQVIGLFSVQQRLAFFMLNLMSKQAFLGQSTTYLTLPMSRRDIADYLFIAQETLSRHLSKLQAEGLLTINRKIIEIHSYRGILKKLKTICGPGQI